MSLDIGTRATLAHINLRKEGGDDNPVTAVDLKLSGMDATISTLALLLGSDSEEEVRAAFWRADQDRNKRFLSMGAVPIDTSVQHLRAKIGGCVLPDATLKMLVL